MNIRNILDKVLSDRLYKGLLAGVGLTLLLELFIYIAVIVFSGDSSYRSKVCEEDSIELKEVTSSEHTEVVPDKKKRKKKDMRADYTLNMTVEDVNDGEIYEYSIPVDKFEKAEGSIRRGEFFSTLMTRLGASQSDIYALDALAKGIFDMKQIKVGYHYHAYYTKDEARDLAYMVYEKDNASYVLFTLLDTLKVEVFEKDIRKVVDYAEVSIEYSLWQDIIDAGAPALLAVKLADIYAWSIDFFGLQKGDSFKVVYEKSVYKDEVLDVGSVLYAEFVHGKEVFKAYFYDDGSGNYYWNEKGESMRKAFLRAPLSYTRISSGFSYNRRHPVTRKVSKHTGIDYAAPTGTEVMTIGDGEVVYKGYKKNEGNMIKIKHNGTYTSAYLHLSKFASGLKVGSRVRQGQVIGYVGSTGRSTGPHLDFRIWKNGSPINPLKMKSPPANPISSELMSDFERSKETAEEAACSFYARTLVRDCMERLRRTGSGE